MTKEVKEVKMITIRELVEEFNLPPLVVRRVLRTAGLRAPQIPDNEGKFGPRARYEWQEGSEELEQVRKILGEYVEKRKTKKKNWNLKAEAEEAEEEE